MELKAVEEAVGEMGRFSVALTGEEAEGAVDVLMERKNKNDDIDIEQTEIRTFFQRNIH